MVFVAAMEGLAAEYRPVIAPADFSHVVNHPYFPLTPGSRRNYIERIGRDIEESTVVVARETKAIMGVRCQEVRETIKLNGQLKEETRDWYAQHRDGSVWYFGEEAKEHKTGGRISTEGSWEAGVDGAQPGIVMPGEPRPGQRFRQQHLRNVAEDMAEIIAVNESVTLPNVTFTRCVKIRDWSMLEAGSTMKWFARGVGLVRFEAARGEEGELVSITKE